jgi:hypothetical protein
MAQGSLTRTLAATAALAALAALALTACSTPAPATAPTPAPPPAATLPPPPPPPPPPPASPPKPADACGAAPLQWLVGKPRTQIPAPVYPDRRRVVCSTCMISQEFVAWRQTIVYDAKTGLVVSVRCG